jgi:hypothetical protein
MAEELIRPIDGDSAHAIEEAAKATSKAIDAITQSGKYAGAVLGDLPHDLVGIMGDWVKHVRARRWAELQRRANISLAACEVLDGILERATRISKEPDRGD